MDLGLTGRVAIVGGASQGIGRATATMLAREGCHVIIAARTERTLTETAAGMRDSLGPAAREISTVVCDLSSRADVERLIETARTAYGRLDVLVNNAGGPPFGRFEQHDDDAWQRAIDTNLMSVVWAVRAALPLLRASGQGRIINVTSTSVREPIDGLVLSNAVRLATTGLAKTLSRELGPDGITVNNVGPGTTMTARIRPLMEAQAKTEGRAFDDVRAERARRIPLGRIGEPDDVAATIVFLASARARQVSGQTILVDGGATAAV